MRTSRDRALERSGGRCEAIVIMHGSHTKIWARCFRSPVEIHHKLTRARGGLLLDEVGEVYHLIALCHKHHAGADGGDAYKAGLLLEGSVARVEGRVVYTGPDDYLARKYR